MAVQKMTSQELAAQLAEERAVLAVQRTDLRERRRLDAEHRDALAEVAVQTTSLGRARRERSRDEEESVALAELYRRAARSGVRARIRTDIQRSAEMRALRIARVRTAALVAGVPILTSFGAWSTAGVQAGVVRLLGLETDSAGWWAAWVMEPALMAVVALIIIGRAVLRSSGGDTDARATFAEWAALSTSVALNLAGGWHGEGWDAFGGALAHSVGPVGAAGSAFLIGLFDSYVTSARPWDGAPRLAELDLTPPPVASSPAPSGGLSDKEQELIDTVLLQARQAGTRLRARAVSARTFHCPPGATPSPTAARQGDALDALAVATAEPATVPPIALPSTRQPEAVEPAAVAVAVPATSTPPAPAKRITRRVATKPAAKPAKSSAERIAELVAKRPNLTQGQVAKKLDLGIRTVQRYWPKPTTTVNGHTPED